VISTERSRTSLTLEGGHNPRCEFRYPTSIDLDSLRADPRFQALLVKFGLPGPVEQNR
jgi:hypothetical protein